MINKLKEKIYFWENLWKETQAKQTLISRNSEDGMAMNQLLKMFSQEMFFPLTKWSLSPKEILHVCNDIIINNRKKVVEFGGGFSTICIAQLIKVRNLDTKLYCVENNENWALELKKYISKNHLSDYITVIYAPLSEVSQNYTFDNQKTWYNTEVLDQNFAQINGVDLVLVDGPFGKSTPYARFSALPYLKNKLANNFTIFIDDTYRKEEKEIVNKWGEILELPAVDYSRYCVIKTLGDFDVTPYSNF